jgi:uncharacterized integral membrane protein
VVAAATTGETMLRKLFMMFVVVPLAVLFVIFAVANRHVVSVSLDPFGSDAPSLTVAMPLFILILTLMGVGVLVGGFATWRSQAKWRRAARRLDVEAQALRIERDALKADLAAREMPALPPPNTSL